MNPNTNPVTPVTPTPVAPAVPATPVPAAPAPVPPVATSNPFQTVTSSDTPDASPKKKFTLPTLSKKMKILFGSLAFLFILLILLSLTSAGQRVKNSILATPTPSPESTPGLPDIGEPSAYATDPEVLDVENRLGDFEKSVNTTELKEDTIRPPQVDWEVSFKKQ